MASNTPKTTPNNTPKTLPARVLADVNFNQTLDGLDLLKALEAEDRSNQNTTAQNIKSLPMHNLLIDSEAANNAALGVIVGYQLNGNRHVPMNLEQNAIGLSEALQAELTQLRDQLKKDPKFRDRKIKQIEDIVPEGTPQKQLLINNAHAILNLAERFDTDFPKGVRIDPKDLVNVLWHLDKRIPGAKDMSGNQLQSDPLPNPLPSVPAAPRQKPDLMKI